jgi:osmotically-inducible protein OsmY
MRRVLYAAALAALLLNLGGCVLELGEGGDTGSSWSHSDSDDSTLARAVRVRLDEDPLTKSSEITVSADHGRVYLDGVTSKPEALAKAIEIALDTPDVKSVRCHVTVVK